MKKYYAIFSRVILCVLLLVGLISTFDKDATYSESERRKLKTAPKLTFSALLDGSFFSDYEAYFADTFPGRESLKDCNTTLNGFYYFGGLADEGEASLILDFSSNGANHGEALPEMDPTDPEQETQSGEQTLPSDETQPAEETEPEKDLPEQTEPEDPPEQLGTVLLVGDRAFDVPGATKESLLKYAAAVNGVADYLGADIQTYSMLVPNSAEFYTHEQYHSGSSSQLGMFELVQENLGSNVTSVDAYTVLANHTDEYIYFRTDHHWTHLGAYYAYTALCDELGMQAESRDKFNTGQWDNFVGTLYTYARDYPQAQVLKDNPDTVYYWKPFADCTSYYYSDTTLSDPHRIGTICTISDDVSNKYLTFMAGDHPVTIVETDTEGPCIMVIKESYGNALISWLTSHYSKIVIIDPREYFKANDDIDLLAFAKEQGVEQCLIVNYPMMLSSGGYIKHLQNLTK